MQYMSICIHHTYITNPVIPKPHPFGQLGSPFGRSSRAFRGLAASQGLPTRPQVTRLLPLGLGGGSCGFLVFCSCLGGGGGGVGFVGFVYVIHVFIYLFFLGGGGGGGAGGVGFVGFVV